MKTRVGKLAVGAGLCLALLGAPAFAEDWGMQSDAGLGFSFTYPAGVFSPLEGDGKPSFYYFASQDEEAELMVGAWENGEGRTPESFKRWLIANAGGYDELTYRPKGENWFVLSGYRDDKIYYEKAMFSCGGKIVNVFAISYPVSQRPLYDRIVERMEDGFKPARACG